MKVTDPVTIESTTAWAPEYWAPYLVNGDASGLEPADLAMAARWADLQARDGWQVVSVGDGAPAFMHMHDASHIGVLAAMCAEYILLRVR